MEWLLNFNSWYRGLPASGKLSLMLVVIGAIICGYLLKSHYKYAGHQYLYTNLSITDLNDISARLQSMNVPVQMKGDAVLVPGNKVLELRNMLATEGYPRGGGVGFELFDKKTFGETEFQQRVNFIRALQGELARTISAIDGIEKARVHLVIPERKLFQEDQQHPSASVALTLYHGRNISDSQVNGIVHMIVTSVEGLTHDNVNVIDNQGRVLFKAAGNDGGPGSGKHLKIQSEIEAKLENQVTKLLEKVVGAGGVIANVSAQINLSQKERMVETLNPESKVAISEQTTTETSSGTTGSAGGIPGAAANLPGGGAEAAGASQSQSTKRTETNATYAFSKTTEKILEPLGAIQKLTVAVLVDGTYKTNDDGTSEYSARSQEEMTKFEELVKKTVGLDEARGDEIRIENIQFNRPSLQDVAQEEFVSATNSSRWTMFMIDNAKLLGIVLIAGLIFFMLVKLVNSYSPPVNVAYANIVGQEAQDVAQALPAKASVNIIKRDTSEAKEKVKQLADTMPDVEMSQGAAGEINFVEQEKSSITVEQVRTSEEKLRLQAAKMQTEQLIKTDVSEAVQILRAWLAEDE